MLRQPWLGELPSFPQSSELTEGALSTSMIGSCGHVSKGAQKGGVAIEASLKPNQLKETHTHVVQWPPNSQRSPNALKPQILGTGLPGVSMP